MRKLGRKRRTPDERLAARELRSTRGYMQNLQKTVQLEKLLSSESLKKPTEK